MTKNGKVKICHQITMGQPKHHSPKTPNFDPLILFFKHKLQTSELTGLSLSTASLVQLICGFLVLAKKLSLTFSF